ncbi:MAG TPA: glycosyltransferase family 4 protein [Mycobacterium sp.]|nr:glycosyltransferase family 4 protein [Mycobacterium sp.]
MGGCARGATMLTAGFGEPMTFSLRASRLVRGRLSQYDVVHDNQSLGYGMLGPSRLAAPLVTTIHHPIHIDRKVELANATGWRRLSLRRWYGFTRMQRRVARRLKCVITVSESSRAEIWTILVSPTITSTSSPSGQTSTGSHPTRQWRACRAVW